MMKWLHGWCGMMLLWLSVTGFAQINESDTSRLQLRTSLTGNYQTGNVDVLTIRSRIDLSVASGKHWVLKMQNNSLYQAFYGRKADNDLFSRNYLYYRPQNKWYPYAIAWISTNFRRRIDARYFAGLGFTCQLVQAKHHVVKLSGNAVYEQSRFTAVAFNQPGYNGKNSIACWRASAYVGGWHYLLHNKMRLYYDAYWQPAIGNASNYRTQLDAGIDFPVWKGLSFTALYAYAHENVVPQLVKQTDNLLSFGFAYYTRKNRH